MSIAMYYVSLMGPSADWEPHEGTGKWVSVKGAIALARKLAGDTSSRMIVVKVSDGGDWRTEEIVWRSWGPDLIPDIDAINDHRRALGRNDMTIEDVVQHYRKMVELDAQSGCDFWYFRPWEGDEE